MAFGKQALLIQIDVGVFRSIVGSISKESGQQGLDIQIDVGLFGALGLPLEASGHELSVTQLDVGFFGVLWLLIEGHVASKLCSYRLMWFSWGCSG